MESKEKFGQFIIQKRKEQNMTQKEFAAKLFVTESAVSKWERGISYPDISLITAICKELHITEHELISASEDYQTREIEKQAKRLKTITTTYSGIFYSAYLLSLLTCFIVNLCVDHCLSWFFLVFTSELTAFSIFNLPVIVREKKGLFTIAGSFAAITLLLATCCIYTHGDWFFMAFVSISCGYVIVFLPFILRSLMKPIGIGNHKALLCIAADSVLIYATTILACRYSKQVSWGDVLEKAVPIVSIGLLLVWGILVIARYVKCNLYFKAAMISVWFGIYSFLVNGFLSMIIDQTGFFHNRINLISWNETYVGGNVNVIIFLVSLILGVIFTVEGLKSIGKK